MSDTSRTGEARRGFAWPSVGLVALILMVLNVAAFFGPDGWSAAVWIQG